jgi:hypothetical protein
MDTDRRAEIAAVGTALLDDLHEQVVASWADLWPAAGSWSPQATMRARAAGRTALEALLTVFEQGDLDEPTLERVRTSVLAATRTLDEADELLRTVRVIGVGRLGDLLIERIQLSHEERWELQREASALGPALLGQREEPEARAIDALLAELERSGPDLR